MVSEDVAARVRSYIQHQGAKGAPAVAAMVAESQGRLLAAMEAVAEPVSTRVPAPGEWCVRELLRHVVDAENGVTTTIERLAAGTPISADARRAVGMRKDDDGRPYAAMLDELRAANARFQATLASLPADPNLTLTAPHPFFGELACIEWAAFQKVHDEDHIQHTGKILAVVGTEA